MSTRKQHRWLVWLLPLIALRVCIPVGFMLAWSDAGLQLVMCSGSGPLVMQGDVSATHAQHSQGESHAADGQHDHSQAHDVSMCPFVVAGTAGVLPSFAAAAAFIATVSQEVPELAGIDSPATAVLIDRIRGPPLA